MQPSRNFDDLKFSSIHRRILLWGSGGPFLDGYVLVMIGVALEQLTPALKLDADLDWLAGRGERSPGCSLAHRCLAISPIKSDGAKCSSLISSPSA
ncbi:major facilitator superfamily protein [Escherichia coli]|uniref:Major facilitator superfamily protein n=1 Tax=Escherichia coli TaxID=562 RepID=A0A376LHG5_ECOLX|nr:major facilitator superfamily protein [Escherichia coli]